MRRVRKIIRAKYYQLIYKFRQKCARVAELLTEMQRKQFDKNVKKAILLLLLLYVGQGIIRGLDKTHTITFTAQAYEQEIGDVCDLDTVSCGDARENRKNKGSDPQSSGGDGMSATKNQAQRGGTSAKSSSPSIESIAQEEGIDWKLLKAICLTESTCRPEAVGDGGTSFGAFQIHLPAHPDITKEQAHDFEWAARWTARHGKKYADNPPMFCKAHNGIGKTTNQWYIDRCMGFYNSL